MKIATWNVNSLKVRLPQLQDWLAQARPDVLGLQETKLVDEDFPDAELAAAGFHAAFIGQKAYNGVALLAREPLADVSFGPPALQDPAQRRIVAATTLGLRILCAYVVNGESLGSPKYRYKLDWLARFTDWVAEELSRYRELVVLGDFNIAPSDADVHDPGAWHEQVLCSSAEREAFRRLTDLGLHDAFRLCHPEAQGCYSWWDYRGGGFARNQGLRIDLLLLSQALVPRLRAAGIDTGPRRRERPSDHAPAWIELA